ncbi:hypothetical protein GCM10020295_00880 [Streptomyces cinereospinus]
MSLGAKALFGEVGQVRGVVVAVEELGDQGLEVLAGTLQNDRELSVGGRAGAEHEGDGDLAYDFPLPVGDVVVGERVG